MASRSEGTSGAVRPPFTIGPASSDLPIVATAIHAGHDVRPDVAAHLALDDGTRRREEDPFTDRVTAAGSRSVVAHRSRFEVDLNRPRESAVYTTPDTAWGLEVWDEPLTARDIDGSLAIHDAFYGALAVHLDELARTGPFVVLDVHSYNHRRDGAGAPSAPAEENPEINVGTGSLDRDRWGDLVDRFMQHLGGESVRGHRLDVRENVRFKGGHLSAWVHERYAGTGCALALELKKVFMDEWTGVPDDHHLAQLTEAIAATVPTMVDALAGHR
jgi:N-formylglutamate deformylase